MLCDSLVVSQILSANPAGPLLRAGEPGVLRLHEKGRQRHDVPAHHRAAAALDEYVAAAELEEPKAALVQSVDPAGRRLTGRTLARRVVLAMIKRRAGGGGASRHLEEGHRAKASPPATYLLGAPLAGSPLAQHGHDQSESCYVSRPC